MGQEIVRREDPKEPGRHSRLCRTEDVFHVLEKDTGTDAIESIYLSFYLPDEAKPFNINAKAFSKMRKLRFLRVQHSPSDINYWRGNPLKYIPSDKLQFLDWHICPSKSWPSSFQPKGLVVLIMHYSRFKRLWKGSMVLDNLKILDLTYSVNLIETPDLSGIPKLEKINLTYCIRLCKVHPSIGTLKQLQELSMSGTRIKQLWNETLVVLDNLKSLNLSDSRKLIETPDLSRAPNLEKIDFSNCTSLCKFHPSIGFLKRLQELSTSGTRIKQLWNETLVVLDNLKSLNLSDSRKLIETPDLSRAPNLEKIDFSNCTSLCKVHPSIGFLKRLKGLSLNGCSRLINFQNILGDMTSLESLSMNFPIFPSVIYSFSSLESLRLDGCSRLEKFPDLSRLECLKKFKAYGTAIRQIPSVNLIPKSIHSLDLEEGKTMPRESRDLVIFINDCCLPKQSSTNHDIGSPVEYEMEEKFRMHIRYDDDSSEVSIQRCSLGSRIPEWVHNKSNGSSLKIELGGNTMPVMGIAIFIVCQFHSIRPGYFQKHDRVAFPILLDDSTLENHLWRFSLALSTNVILDKPIVLCEYLWHPKYLPSWRLKRLYKRKIFTIAKFTGFHDRTRFVEVEVKEWGLHLVSPDDAALGLGSDLVSFVDFINLGLETQHDKNED